MTTPKDILDSIFGANQTAYGPAALDDLMVFDHVKTPTDCAFAAQLPEAHKRLLAQSDGLDLLQGSYRLLGWNTPAGYGLATWNDPETWKFAWDTTALPWVCFGWSVLGNQFAYHMSELAQGKTPRVYELFAATLAPVCHFDSFEVFLDAGFVNGVQDDSYHGRIAEARAQMGGFEQGQNLAYMPSPLLTGGQLDGLELVPMTAQAHMIINGDLHRQLAHLDTLDGLHSLDNYSDAKGRLRIRAHFSGEAKQ